MTRRGADFPDQLPGLDMIPDGNEEFRLVIVGAKNSLAVVDDGGIPAHRLQAGKDHHPICGGIDIQRMGLRTDSEIDPGMKIMQSPAIVGAAVAETRPDAIRGCRPAIGKPHSSTFPASPRRSGKAAIGLPDR